MMKTKNDQKRTQKLHFSGPKCSPPGLPDCEAASASSLKVRPQWGPHMKYVKTCQDSLSVPNGCSIAVICTGPHLWLSEWYRKYFVDRKWISGSISIWGSEASDISPCQIPWRFLQRPSWQHSTPSVFQRPDEGTKNHPKHRHKPGHKWNHENLLARFSEINNCDSSNLPWINQPHVSRTTPYWCWSWRSTRVEHRFFCCTLEFFRCFKSVQPLQFYHDFFEDFSGKNSHGKPILARCRAFLAASESPEAPLAARIAWRKAKDLGAAKICKDGLGKIPPTWRGFWAIFMEIWHI